MSAPFQAYLLPLPSLLPHRHLGFGSDEALPFDVCGSVIFEGEIVEG